MVGFVGPRCPGPDPPLCAVFVVFVALAYLNPDPKNDPSREPGLNAKAMGYAAWVLVPSGILLAGVLPPLALGVGRFRSFLVSTGVFCIAFGLAYASEGSPESLVAVAAVPALIAMIASLMTNGARANAAVALIATAYAAATYATYLYLSGLAFVVVGLASWLVLPPLAGASRPRGGERSGG